MSQPVDPDIPPPPPNVGTSGLTKVGVAPPGMYIDPKTDLVLQDGVSVASVGRRIGAYFLGFLLFIITLGIGYVIWGLIIWRRGQTPTLQVLGMRCMRPATGRIAGWWWMAFREIVGRFIEGILGPITLLVSLIFLITTRRNQCLHDLIAGTVVLHDPERVLHD